MKSICNLLTLVALLFVTTACVTMEQQYQSRVEHSVDRPLYSAFYPSPLPEKSGFNTQVYDDYVRILMRVGTVNMIGEARQRYVAATTASDPVLDTYLGVTTKRGGKVKMYKGILNQKLFVASGVTNFWPVAQKMANEDAAYLEFDASGRVRSGLIRRAVFEPGSLGISTFCENFILTGTSVRSLENRISNREMDESFIKEIAAAN